MYQIFQLINKIIKTRKPTIVSTGMASKLTEIEKVYKLFKHKKVDLSLLHCISSYPTKETDANLSNIIYMVKDLNVILGYQTIQTELKFQFLEHYWVQI